MLDSIAELSEEKDDATSTAAPSALVRLAELNQMLSTAVGRLEKLEDRATQLRDGAFEQLLVQSVEEDSSNSSSSDSDSDDQEDSKVLEAQPTMPLQQQCSRLSESSLADLREMVDAALVNILSSPGIRRPDGMYSALAEALNNG